MRTLLILPLLVLATGCPEDDGGCGPDDCPAGQFCFHEAYDIPGSCMDVPEECDAFDTLCECIDLGNDCPADSLVECIESGDSAEIICG